MTTKSGAKIKHIREVLHIGQGQLAQLIGAGRQATVSAWENDRHEPDRGTLRLIADLTNKSDEVYQWLTSSGPMPVFAPVGVSRPTGPTSGSSVKISSSGTEFLAWISTQAANGVMVSAQEVLERAVKALGNVSDVQGD